MRVLVNGVPHELPEGTTVTDLVRQLELVPERVAIERNGRIVPRSEHARTPLAEGDRLEVVTLVGGG